MTPPCHVLRCFIYTGNVAGLANKKEVKTKVAVDGLGRKGPGDPRWWHRAGECSWVTLPEPSDDDESSDSWPALWSCLVAVAVGRSRVSVAVWPAGSHNPCVLYHRDTSDTCDFICRLS